MKDLCYLVASTIILAPVFMVFVCENMFVVFFAVFYGFMLAVVSHSPRVRKFMLRAYRAELRLVSGKFTLGL